VSTQQRIVKIRTDGSVTLPTTGATVWLSVVAHEAEAPAAMDLCVDRTIRVADAAVDAGAKPEAIASEPMRVDVSTRAPDGRPSGYEATQDVRIKLDDDLDMVGAVISACSGAGGDGFRFHGIEPRGGFVRESFRQARQRAFDAARADAEDMALTAGLRLGRVLDLEVDSEIRGHTPRGSEPTSGSREAHVGLVATFELRAGDLAHDPTETVG
jgi:uncharacterized protein YggE